MQEGQPKRNGQEGGVGSFGVATRNVQKEAKQFVASLGELSGETERALRDAMTERPYAALGIAVGAGYVLGGGLRAKLTAVLLAFAGRMIANRLASQLLVQTRR